MDVKLWSRGEEVKQLLSAAPTRRARSQPAGPGQEEEKKKQEEEVVGFVGPATEWPGETAMYTPTVCLRVSCSLGSVLIARLAKS